MKRCPSCGWNKPLDAFYRDKSNPNGRRFICKACDKAKSKAYYQANADRKRAYAKERNARLRARQAK